MLTRVSCLKQGQCRNHPYIQVPIVPVGLRTGINVAATAVECVQSRVYQVTIRESYYPGNDRIPL